MSTWASVAADTAESWTYIETIWDAGASVWDDGTSFWDGAYRNDWGAVVDSAIETWWPPGTIEVYFSFGKLTT